MQCAAQRATLPAPSATQTQQHRVRQHRTRWRAGSTATKPGGGLGCRRRSPRRRRRRCSHQPLSNRGRGFATNHLLGCTGCDVLLSANLCVAVVVAVPTPQITCSVAQAVMLCSLLLCNMPSSASPKLQPTSATVRGTAGSPWSEMVGSESPVKDFLELPDTGGVAPIRCRRSGYAAISRWPLENALVWIYCIHVNEKRLCQLLPAIAASGAPWLQAPLPTGYSGTTVLAVDFLSHQCVPGECPPNECHHAEFIFVTEDFLPNASELRWCYEERCAHAAAAAACSSNGFNRASRSVLLDGTHWTVHTAWARFLARQHAKLPGAVAGSCWTRCVSSRRS